MKKTCREVAEQITYQDDLNIFEKTILRIHLFLCKKCQKVDQQLNELDDSLMRIHLQQSESDQEKINEIKNKAKYKAD